MKRLLKHILIFTSYFVYSFIFKVILYTFNINYFTFNTDQKILFAIITSIIYISTIIFIYRKELKIDIIDFKNNYKNYLSKNIIIYLAGILLMAISNMLLSKITSQNISTNETLIREYINQYPIYMALSAVIFSPLIEELIFRKTIKNIFKYKYLFIIISGVLFGLTHINSFSLNELLFSIPYIIMGIDFAYIYYKTNNIFTTITIHLCHNLILLIFQFI